jgi:hypothetical protein
MMMVMLSPWWVSPQIQAPKTQWAQRKVLIFVSQALDVNPDPNLTLLHLSEAHLENGDSDTYVRRSLESVGWVCSNPWQT